MSIRMGRQKKNKNGMVYISKERAAVSDIPTTMPKPTFFSDAEIKRMMQTPGAYQYKGR